MTSRSWETLSNTTVLRLMKCQWMLLILYNIPRGLLGGVGFAYLVVGNSVWMWFLAGMHSWCSCKHWHLVTLEFLPEWLTVPELVFSFWWGWELRLMCKLCWDVTSNVLLLILNLYLRFKRHFITDFWFNYSAQLRAHRVYCSCSCLIIAAKKWGSRNLVSNSCDYDFELNDFGEWIVKFLEWVLRIWGMTWEFRDSKIYLPQIVSTSSQNQSFNLVFFYPLIPILIGLSYKQLKSKT